MNVGEIVNKISELKSKRAVAAQLVMYLNTHYVSADVGMAEMTVRRDDGHMVSEDHIKSFIDDLNHMIDEAEAMQAEFENFTALDSEDPDEDDGLDDIIRKKARKKTDAPGSRKRGNRPASKDSDAD